MDGAAAPPPRTNGHLRVLLDALIETTRTVVTATDRAGVLDGACRTLVSAGIFSMVWIGGDEDEDGWLERLAVAGDDAGYTDGIRIAVSADVPEGRGPSGTAIRSGEPFICRDVETDERMGPWRARYTAAGFRSSAAFPLHSRTMPTGVLTAYDGAVGAFAVDEVRILEEIADTVGLAIDAIAEREARAAEVALELAVRERLARTIERVTGDLTIEDAAAILCAELGDIPGLDIVGLLAFAFEDQATALVTHVPRDFTATLSPTGAVARMARERVGEGPRAISWSPHRRDGEWAEQFTDLGVRALVFGPILHGDHPEGALVIATSDPRIADTLIRRIRTVGEIWNATSALLAERLHAWRERVETRAAIDAIVAETAFETLFQPIVELASGEVVAYEAITRYADGEPAEARLARAWAVGLGPELELATIRGAVAAARALPAASSLDIDVSPGLLAEPTGLAAAIAGADRPLILEVAEDEAVDDYERLRDRIADLGPDLRLAIDGAAAGFASGGHMVELDPAFVKLDPGLVRGINAHLGRQALVVGLRHFSRRSGCRLIALGVETDAEVDTLTSIGVELAQGDRFGPPAPATSWKAPRRGRGLADR